MQKRILFSVAIIVGLVLTVYGGHIFQNIKAGHNQATGTESQAVIQLGPSAKQTILTEPVWTLVKQTATRDLSVRNLDTVRGGPPLPSEPVKGQVEAGHFFIAGIIFENQSKDLEERTRFLGDDQPQLVNAGSIYPSNSDVAIN